MTDADKTRIEKAPYFHLSKNEYGKMWLMYNPDEEGRFKCWEPITGEFWQEFEKLQATGERFKELEQEVRKYVFWHDKFFNDTIVGQPPSLQPLRDLIKSNQSEQNKLEI